MERLYVLPQDVCNITGKKTPVRSESSKGSQNLLIKQKHQYITKNEMADYLGLDRDPIILDEMGWRTSKS